MAALELDGRVQAIAVTRGVLRNAGAMGFFYGRDPRRATDVQVGFIVDETFAFHLVFDEAPPWAATASGDTG